MPHISKKAAMVDFSFTSFANSWAFILFKYFLKDDILAFHVTATAVDRKHAEKCSVKILVFFSPNFSLSGPHLDVSSSIFLSNLAQWVTYVIIPDTSYTANISLSCASSELCRLIHLVFLCTAGKKKAISHMTGETVTVLTLMWRVSTESSQATEETNAVHSPASTAELFSRSWILPTNTNWFTRWH